MPAGKDPFKHAIDCQIGIGGRSCGCCNPGAGAKCSKRKRKARKLMTKRARQIVKRMTKAEIESAD